MSSRRRKLLTAISLLAIAGIAISSISLYHHYGHAESSFCDFGANFNCDLVNRSTYSVIAGIPVALIGILGYGAVLGLSLWYRRTEGATTILFAASVAGLALAAYLTYVEKFILAVWCILCLSSLCVIVGITFLSGLLTMKWTRR